MTARKHPFHWDTYNRLLDGLTRVMDSNDQRLRPEVREKLTEARGAIYQAWEVQAALERAKGQRT
ncbi:hypothetical protein SAMN05444164_0708 [Bradyrhizobium erythrophlei]|uniref:Uncharacterized protein n=1 Tax=Bradyrhizobium erythrophlei TaxID=1437360 RepID=A0A1H4NRH4_9BRAD|nr:hypothetical protein SAMN05444164_0708 [Bradyrhizobium erythrophlei]